MKCKICEIESPQDVCDACKADKDRIDKHERQDHKDKVRWLLNMPSHLFFYGLKYMLMDTDSTGMTLNDYLLKVDNRNGAPVWQRLKGYRGGRGYQGNFDRWDTNPLLAKGA